MAKTSASMQKSMGTNKSNPKRVSQHTKVSEMVNTAISTLKERRGSSLQAIKKYIASHYKVDLDKLSPFIRKYLKYSVASGILVQTKGKGASGSFKMASKNKKQENSKPKSLTPKAKITGKATAVKEAKKKTQNKISVLKKTTNKNYNSQKKPKEILKPLKAKKTARIMRIDGTKASSSNLVIKEPIMRKEMSHKTAKENLTSQKSKKIAGIMKTSRNNNKAPSRKMSHKTAKKNLTSQKSKKIAGIMKTSRYNNKAPSRKA